MIIEGFVKFHIGHRVYKLDVSIRFDRTIVIHLMMFEVQFSDHCRVQKWYLFLFVKMSFSWHIALLEQRNQSQPLKYKSNPTLLTATCLLTSRRMSIKDCSGLERSMAEHKDWINQDPVSGDLKL